MKKFCTIFLCLLFSNLSFSQNILSGSSLVTSNFNQTKKIVKGQVKTAGNYENKIDPLLRYVLSKSAAITNTILSVDRNKPAITSLVPFKVNQSNQVMVPILIKSASTEITSKLVSSIGGNVYTVSGNILVADIPLNSVNSLISSESTLCAEASILRKPELNESIADVKADAVHAGTGLPKAFKGKGVIVGVVDSGIDWKNNDFKNTEGSRIKYLWDMSGNVNPPADFDYGTEYTKNQLDASQCNEKDLDEGHGHGTHVTGIAAGAGMNNTSFLGMAPEADIIFVKGFKEGPGFIDGDIINGCDYIFKKAQALSKPAVINLSLGGQIGAHDGTALYEQALSNLTAPGKIIVKSAGNDGYSSIHLSYETSGSAYDEASFTFWLTATGTKYTLADMWYDEGNISVGIAAFDKDLKIIARTEPIQPGNKVENLSFTVDQKTCGIVTIDATTTSDPNNGAKRVFLVIDSNNGQIDLSQVYWALFTYGSGSFDAWIASGGIFTRDDVPSQRIKPGDSKKTISPPGTAKKVICTGSYVTKNEWIDIDGVKRNQLNPNPDGSPNNVIPEKGQCSFFSSIGPSRDGRILPDISAPGELIFSVLSSDLTEGTGYTRERVLQGGSYQGMEGTSMASPHVTGLVALMLEANPNLDYAQAVQILKETARVDNYTGAVPNNSFGAGKIDALEALKKVAGTGTAVASVNSQKIDMNVKPGDTVDENFILFNTGDAVLNYQIVVTQPHLTSSKVNYSKILSNSKPFKQLVKSGLMESSSKKISSFANKNSISNYNSNKQIEGSDILILDDGNNTPDTFIGFNYGQNFTWVNEYDVSGFSFTLESFQFYLQTQSAFSNSVYISVLDKNLSELMGDYEQLNLATSGSWFTITLDNSINFSDGQKFYILVSTFYSYIDFPAGFDNQAQAKNKSYFISNDTLYNMNTNPAFKDGAFLIRAVGTKVITGTNKNPVAVATLNPTEAKVNESVSFDASSSYDTDGTIVKYSWTFGDGATSSEMKTNHQYTIPATYNYKLTVTDDKGATDDATGQIKINQATSNKSPYAVANVSKAQAVISEQITFDASNSYDTDGQITSYLWEFGDGSSSNQKIANHTYTQANTYNYKLTVTDNEGAKGDVPGQVIISDTPPKLTSAPNSGSVAAGSQKTIGVSLDAADLTEGKYLAQININSNGGNISLPVNINVSSSVSVDDPDMLPVNYNLYQNYPNPFNPVTNIKFQVPKKTFVTLKVYDVIGREVAVLLREEKRIGTYNIIFNASNLPSGVYFYRLFSDNFNDTKKFILLK